MDFPRYIAHRGIHDKEGGIPENSLAAFAAAADKGFAAELDVRFTADRKAVVFHDEDTERMCGESMKISETNYSELRRLRLENTDEHIPLLAEVLRLVNGRVMLFIELKNVRTVPDAEKRLAHLMKKYCGEFAVQSFNPLSLSRLRAANPDIVRGQLISTYSGSKHFLRSLAAEKLVWKTVSKPQYIACDLRSVTLEAAFRAADIDAHFITWTADGEELIKAAETFSGSIIFENVPERYFDGKR